MSWINKCIDGLLCGGVTGCIVSAILLIFGVPLFTAGVALVALFGIHGDTIASQAGLVMLTVAMLLVIVGVLTVLYMCRMGSKLLKTTPPRHHQRIAEERNTYQRFSNEPSAAPPAYEESLTHAQYYPDTRGLYPVGYQAQGGDTAPAPIQPQKGQQPRLAPCGPAGLQAAHKSTGSRSREVSWNARPQPGAAGNVPSAPAYAEYTPWPAAAQSRAAVVGPSAPPLPFYSLPVAPSAVNAAPLPAKL